MEPERSGARRSQIYFVFFFPRQQKKKNKIHIELKGLNEEAYELAKTILKPLGGKGWR